MSRTLFVGERQALEKGAGDYVAERVEQNPAIALGGATGRSPRAVYETALLAGVDFSRANIFFLDEYFGFVGVAPNPGGQDGLHTSYRGFAQFHLRTKPLTLGVPGNKVFQLPNIHTPRGNFYEADRLVDSPRLDAILAENRGDFEWLGLATIEADSDGLTACYGIGTPLEVVKGSSGQPVRTFLPVVNIHANARHPVLREISMANDAYEARARGARVALQVLGIGVEGHIAFNERGTPAETRTHLTALAFSTLKANEDDHAGGEATWYAITQGIDTVLNAHELMLLAFGESKANAVNNMLCQPSSPLVPASFIQSHPNVRLYLDWPAVESVGLAPLERQGWQVSEVG